MVPWPDPTEALQEFKYLCQRYLGKTNLSKALMDQLYCFQRENRILLGAAPAESTFWEMKDYSCTFKKVISRMFISWV